MFGLSLALALLIASTETDIIISDSTKDAEITDIQDEKKIDDQQQPTIEPIVITNAIEPSMLAYKHWTGTYSPELFTITINGSIIEAGQTYTLADPETPLVVQCDYSFMNGIRKGTKKISYHMNKDCTNVQLTFSWLDDRKVIIENATAVMQETI